MTTVSRNETLSISEEIDVVMARNKVRLFAKEAGLGLVDETKLITAASELTRNMLLYANGGTISIEHVSVAETAGVRIRFEDCGPGIVDLALAMTDGYSSNNGLGLGLPGARRLVDEFQINTKKGEGTVIVVTKWKR